MGLRQSWFKKPKCQHEWTEIDKLRNEEGLRPATIIIHQCSLCPRMLREYQYDDGTVRGIESPDAYSHHLV